MFRQEKTSFGRFEKLVIEDQNGRSRLALSPDGCAALLELTLDGHSLLDAYETPEALANNAWYKNVVLFPFPNRLQDGQYTWEGMQRTFPINDTATNNALHGHSRMFSSIVERVDLQASEASVTCRYQDNGSNPAYPFLYTLDIVHRLQGNDHFEMEIRFKNEDDQPIPIGLGWHPYFRLGDRIENISLQLPACELVGIDQRMLPTGKRYPYDSFETTAKIGATVLDNCFALKPEAGKAELILSNSHGHLHYWQETGPGKNNFLQLFTHPERTSFAIEPMTCNVNAFNNKDGLIVLAPGEQAISRFGLWWEKA